MNTTTKGRIDIQVQLRDTPGCHIVKFGNREAGSTHCVFGALIWPGGDAGAKIERGFSSEIPLLMNADSLTFFMIRVLMGGKEHESTWAIPAHACLPCLIRPKGQRSTDSLRIRKMFAQIELRREELGLQVPTPPQSKLLELIRDHARFPRGTYGSQKVSGLSLLEVDGVHLVLVINDGKKYFTFSELEMDIATMTDFACLFLRDRYAELEDERYYIPWLLTRDEYAQFLRGNPKATPATIGRASSRLDNLTPEEMAGVIERYLLINLGAQYQKREGLPYAIGILLAEQLKSLGPSGSLESLLPLPSEIPSMIRTIDELQNRSSDPTPEQQEELRELAKSVLAEEIKALKVKEQELRAEQEFLAELGKESEKSLAAAEEKAKQILADAESVKKRREIELDDREEALEKREQAVNGFYQRLGEQTVAGLVPQPRTTVDARNGKPLPPPRR